MEPVTAIILGAGDRGVFTYADYASRHPQELKIVGVAEPDDTRRGALAAQHDIPREQSFRDWKEALAAPKFADLVIICTQDRMHVQPALQAMDSGYNLLIEKPIAPTVEECLLLDKKAAESEVSISVSHVLRYTPFFITLKRLLDQNAIGRLRGIQHNENVGHIHYSHSYVRGNWRRSEESSPMILAKSCHDMDILLYLVGADCEHVSSTGSRGAFSSDRAPEGAPARCLDGCPHEATCQYYAPKIYLTGNTGWPVSVITHDTSPEGITKALQEGPYGRCVYACDNDMTEHQSVLMKFKNDVTASFVLSAFTHETSRTIKLVGEEGELSGNMESGEIVLHDFQSKHTHTIDLHAGSLAGGHNGGDEGLIGTVIRHVKSPHSIEQKTSLHSAVQSHIMAFAAQQSMEKQTVVRLSEMSGS
ncbi:MAG: Gfo/Idh/MocA family protein [Spirochaetota bacterium]